MTRTFSTADLPLARRVEAAEAANGFRVARAVAQASPGIGAVVEPFLGGCALFGGVGSPMTHALGIGMTGPAAAEELDRMEAFFRERGSPVLIDLCPLAHPSLLELIFSRGYRVIEFNNLMIRRIRPGELPPPVLPDSVTVSVAGEGDLETWGRTVARGFQERDDIDDAFVEMLAGTSLASQCYLARRGPDAIAGGAMSIQSGIAYFFGDATVLAARGRGAQSALIQARLADAGRAGCDLAMACVVPGTASHRNYERAGFELLFMRVNLSLP
jgi:GNAT superfamily N-acetyltransferase